MYKLRKYCGLIIVFTTLISIVNLVWSNRQCIPENKIFVAFGSTTSNSSIPMKDKSTSDISSVFISRDGVHWQTYPVTVPPWAIGRAVIWNGSQFLVIDHAGGSQISYDGFAWSPGIRSPYGALNSVTWTGTEYVAVGNSPDGTEGTVLTSGDGVKWSLQPTNIGEPLFSIVYNDKMFIATGGNGAIYTTDDSRYWTKQTSGTKNLLSAVAWNGTQFVIVGDNGVILTSSNGYQWVSHYTQTQNSLSNVIWGGTKFIAIGSEGTIISSQDGNTWRIENSTVSSPVKHTVLN
jgi:hypothetical protein